MNEKPDGLFYFGWLISGMFSLGLSLMLAALPLALLVAILGDTFSVRGQMHITEDYLFGYTFIPLFGLLLGAFQYLLLRRYFPRMGWWILTTIVAWVPAWLLISTGSQPLGNFLATGTVVYTLLGGMALGLLIGCLQWLMLRGRLPRIGWWIPASMLGFGLAGVGMWKLSSIGQAALAISLPGVLTALVWWLAFRAQDSHRD